MTKQELKQELSTRSENVPAFLDDIVHDAASTLASNANNGGVDAQLDFLMDKCGWDAEDILKQI